MNHARDKQTARIEAVLSSLIFLTFSSIYIFNAAPGLYWEHSSDFSLTTHILSVSHPTGYGVFNLVGKLFTYLPFEQSLFQVNLMTAVTGALSLCLVFVVFNRFFGRVIFQEMREKNKFAYYTTSIVALCSIGFSSAFWDVMGISEIGFFYFLFFMALFYLLLDCVTNRNLVSIALAVFCFSLMTGFHVVSYMAFVPAAAYYLYVGQTDKRISIPQVLNYAFGFALALGTIAFLYVPLRSAASPLYNWGSNETLKEIYDSLLVYEPGLYIGTVSAYLDKITSLVGEAVFDQFTLAFVGFSIVGFFVLLFKSIREWYLLAGLLATLFAVVSLVGPSPNYMSYILPMYAVMGITFGIGLLWTMELACPKSVRRRCAFIAGAVVPALIFCLSLTPLYLNNFSKLSRFLPFRENIKSISFSPLFKGDFENFNRSGEVYTEIYAEKILDDLPEKSILLINDAATYFPLRSVKVLKYPSKDIVLVWEYLLWREWYQREVEKLIPGLRLEELKKKIEGESGDNAQFTYALYTAMYEKLGDRYSFFVNFFPEGYSKGKFGGPWDQLSAYGFVFSLGGRNAREGKAPAAATLAISGKFADDYTKKIFTRQTTHLARYYIDKREFEKANDLLNAVFDVVPETRENLLDELSAVHVGLGKYDEARRALKGAADKAQSPAEVYDTMGLVDALRKDPEAAIENFKKSIELAPDQFKPVDDLSRLLEQTGRGREALEVIERFIQRNPYELKPYFHKSSLEFRLGDAAAAEKTLLRATEADKWLSDPYIELSDFYRFTGRMEKAVEAYQKAIERAPDDFRLYVNVGNLYAQMGKPREAEEAYHKALKIAPGDVLASANLAYSYALRGEKLDEALSMIQRCLKKDPENPDFIDTLGVIYYQKGEREKALEHFERAAALSPENPEIREHLKRAKAESGK